MARKSRNDAPASEQNLEWIEHVNEGWHALLKRLMLGIRKIDPTLRVIDTKQKFGSLRVRLDRYDERAYALIDEAASESLKICEHCGAGGSLRNDAGYFVTLCDQHAEGTAISARSPSISVRLIVSPETLDDCRYSKRERDSIGLFLDVLPSAWGLTEDQLEGLLRLPVGWLRAWRNHEVEIDDDLAAAVLTLGALQRGMRLVRTPGEYAGFWHHRWSSDGPIGARTPLQAFEEDGWPAVDTILQYLHKGLQ